MAKYLVTGGAGFIGSHVTDGLLAQGHQVRIIDDLSSGTLDNLKHVADKIEFLEGDICDRELMKKACAGIDRVIHLAALRSVPKSMDDPYSYSHVNITATTGLLEAAVAAKVQRVVQISSSSVYGEETDEMPLKEDGPTGPISPYAASKLCDEIMCSTFTKGFGLETVCVRYFNVFGPRQSLENQYAVLIPKIITSVMKDQSPPVYGDGNQSRDFTYIENVVEGTIKASEVPGVSGEVFNIALGEEHTVLDVLNGVNKILGKDVKPDHLPKRQGDVYRTFADASKARNLLGFKGSVSFHEGLERTVDWFQKNPVHEL